MAVAAGAAAASRRSGGTASDHPLLRLADSQISHGARPGYLSGARGELDVGADALGHLADRRREPAGAAVGDRRVQVGRRSSSTSISSFSVIGSPICTLAPATSPVVASIVALENVAPRMPSRPVRPPRTTTRSPACGPGRRVRVGGGADAAAEHQRVGGVRRGRRAPRRRPSAGRSCCRSRRRRRRRPSRIRRGCSTPSGSSSAGRSGGPKHSTSVTAIGRWAAPRTSRITPPTPVLAPPNGSTADGWLCVSAFSASVVPRANETMPALPTNAERTNGARDALGGVAQLAQQRCDRSRRRR